MFTISTSSSELLADPFSTKGLSTEFKLSYLLIKFYFILIIMSIYEIYNDINQ